MNPNLITKEKDTVKINTIISPKRVISSSAKKYRIIPQSERAEFFRTGNFKNQEIKDFYRIELKDNIHLK